MKLHKKVITLGFSVLLYAGCTTDMSDSYLNPNDYGQTIEFLSDNFEMEYVPPKSYVPDYLDGYDIEYFSNYIAMAFNNSEQITALRFDSLSAEEVKVVLDGINMDIDEALQLLLDDVDDFYEEHWQTHLTYDFDDYGVHILGTENAIVEAKNIRGPYNLKIFYNKNIFEDFLKK